MSASREDIEFLALLVHRGWLEEFQARALMEPLKAGAELDDLLVRRMDWEPRKVERLRRTRAGEEPEIPGYEVLGRLGSGGTADVFRARDRRTGRPVALKILHPRLVRDPEQRQAFVAEAKLLASLDHPNLVKGFGVARSGETYFARLDLVDGKTLLEYLDEGQAFEEEVALRVVLEVAEALEYMAGRGYVHRDVKPGNIMLTSNGRVKLIDLGFCAQKGERCAEGTARGTEEYLSPENAQGGAAADERSDVYSLGVTLFQLVVGRLPFESSEDRDVLRQHVMESLKSPELKGRGISPHVHYFIEKMMAKDPGERYQTWDELISDVRNQIEGREALDYGRASRDGRGRGPGWRRTPGRRRQGP